MLRVQHVADHDADRERAEADEEPLAQLVEMLDERRLLAVVQAPRKPGPRWPPNHRLPKRKRPRAVRFRARARTTKERSPRPPPPPSVLRRCRRGRNRRRKLRASLDLLVSADGVLELTHAGTERAADLRQPLGAEEQQGEKEQSDDLHGADVWHGGIVAACSRRWRKRPCEVEARRGASRLPG